MGRDGTIKLKKELKIYEKDIKISNTAWKERIGMGKSWKDLNYLIIDVEGPQKNTKIFEKAWKAVRTLMKNSF